MPMIELLMQIQIDRWCCAHAHTYLSFSAALPLADHTKGPWQSDSPTAARLASIIHRAIAVTKGGRLVTPRLLQADIPHKGLL